MDNQSDCVRAGLEEVQGNIKVSSPTSAKWQEALAALEARMLRAENELNVYKEQNPLPIPVTEVPQVQASVTDNSMSVVDGEPWYERLRSQYPPTFEGGTDQTRARRWLALITSIMDYMEIEDHERVTCAIELLRNDARNWWGRSVKECTYHVVDRVPEGIW